MVDGDHGEFRDWSVFFPVQGSELDELSGGGGRSPPSSDTARGFQQFRDQVESSPGFDWNSRAFCDTFHLILPSLRSVLFGDDVVEIEDSFGDSNSRLSEFMPEPLGKHGDLGDVVGDEVGTPFKEFFLHDFEFVLEKSSVGESHFLGIALERSDVEFSSIIVLNK
jgi:hypothetical protein